MMITKGRIWEEHRYCPLVARNHILASLCPQVSGVYVVKLAVAMVMAGSVAGRISSAAGRGPRTVVSGSWRPRAGGRRTLLHRRVQLHQGAGQDETRPWSSRAAAAQRRGRCDCRGGPGVPSDPALHPPGGHQPEAVNTALPAVSLFHPVPRLGPRHQTVQPHRDPAGAVSSAAKVSTQPHPGEKDSKDPHSHFIQPQQRSGTVQNHLHTSDISNYEQSEKLSSINDTNRKDVNSSIIALMSEDPHSLSVIMNESITFCS